MNNNTSFIQPLAEQAGSKAAMPTLADVLNHRSRQLGLTLTQVASDAGMTRAYLHRLSTGGVPNPGILTLQRVAKALRMPASALYRLFSHDDLPVQRKDRLTYEGLHDMRDVLVFAADVTVPDHTVMMPGERFTKIWAIQNVGQVPWPERQLVRIDEQLVIAAQGYGGLGRGGHLLDAHLDSLGQSILVPPALPGQVLELSVDFAAPLENCSCASVWQLQTLQGHPCYPAKCFLQVVVTVLGD